MLAKNQVNDILSSRVESGGTLYLHCPICESDVGETEGLAGPMDGSPDGVVIMRCGECTSIYLSPARDVLGGSPPSLPVSVLRMNRIRTWTRGLPSTARVLCVDCASERHLRAFARAAGTDWAIEGTESNSRISHSSDSYDLIVLSHTLESVREPVELLRHLKLLLASGGRVVVIVSNVGSTGFRVFGGRHWSGYEYPATRQHFNADALHRLGKNAGLSVRNVTTMFASQSWLRSVKNWFRDWGVVEGWVSVVAGRWLVPQVIAAAIEGLAQLRGRGSLLVAELEKE